MPKMWRVKCQVMVGYDKYLLWAQDCGCCVHFTCMSGWVGARSCRWTVYLRSTLNAQRTHPVHSHVAHIHALGVNLNAAALEVLLVEHVHLESRCKENDSGSENGSHRGGNRLYHSQTEGSKNRTGRRWAVQKEGEWSHCVDMTATSTVP